MIEQSWTSLDGIKLYAVLWQPAAPPKAVLAFVHGHGTHCRRYEEWFQLFVEAGFAVISFDLRGHGCSEGKRGTIHRYTEYLDDTALLMEKTRKYFRDLPVVLYGHSMGATIVLSYLERKNNLPEMAVLASAWLELVQPPGKVKSLAIWLADTLFPQLTINTGLKSKDFCSARRKRTTERTGSADAQKNIGTMLQGGTTGRQKNQCRNYSRHNPVAVHARIPRQGCFAGYFQKTGREPSRKCNFPRMGRRAPPTARLGSERQRDKFYHRMDK